MILSYTPPNVLAQVVLSDKDAVLDLDDEGNGFYINDGDPLGSAVTKQMQVGLQTITASKPTYTKSGAYFGGDDYFTYACAGTTEAVFVAFKPETGSIGSVERCIINLSSGTDYAALILGKGTGFNILKFETKISGVTANRRWTGTSTIVENGWNIAAIWHNGTTWEIWFNGVRVDNTGTGTVSSKDVTQLIIAQTAGTYSTFIGTINHILVYNTCTSAQRDAIFTEMKKTYAL